ncbi:MAG: aminotransferase class I/II-fold pyridoxal phosphate-dependent enzyme [Oscillospiraceae bacterium]|jgi:histidinol-phosphate aminotransferase|nr:aminotransferase class I/II-fold pyridoxal phosphate-dependent enzyme [Oscillospiraceae bacterium]
MADTKLWSERIRAQTPYTAGEQPDRTDVIKLNTNENPYPPSPKVLAAIRAAVNGDLRLYPPVPDEPRRFWGNGSDEILAMAFMAFFSGKKLYAPDITYSFYPVWAKMFDAEYRTIPLNEDFSVPAEAFYGLDGCAVIANPNAPTGLALSEAEIAGIVESNPDNLVLVDEAYLDFSGMASASRLIEKYSNLLVVKTMSKSYALAGMRIGWAEGNESLIQALRIVRDSVNSYTLDRLALSAAEAALEDTEYYAKAAQMVADTRERSKRQLEELGFRVTDSRANFLFASHPKVGAETLQKRLREQGILVRRWSLPRIENFLRISIGTDSQMETLVSALREILQ